MRCCDPCKWAWNLRRHSSMFFESFNLNGVAHLDPDKCLPLRSVHARLI